MKYKGVLLNPQSEVSTSTRMMVLFSTCQLVLLEPFHFVMERGMLQGIKRRAESPTHERRLLDLLLGGHLHEIPAVCELASPVTHVHPGCPPTRLIKGNLDLITPIAAFHVLHHRLVECGVPVVNILYPLTQHAFDLLLPQVSPPAQAALYEVERSLALTAAGRFQARGCSALPAEAMSFSKLPA